MAQDHQRAVGSALRNVVLPEEVSFLAVTTLIGGTIGGGAPLVPGADPHILGARS